MLTPPPSLPISLAPKDCVRRVPSCRLCRHRPGLQRGPPRQYSHTCLPQQDTCPDRQGQEGGLGAKGLWRIWIRARHAGRRIWWGPGCRRRGGGERRRRRRRREGLEPPPAALGVRGGGVGADLLFLSLSPPPPPPQEEEEEQEVEEEERAAAAEEVVAA